MVQTDAEWGSGMGPASNCTSQPCGPSGRLVMTFGYVITDLRIYPPPSPSRYGCLRVTYICACSTVRGWGYMGDADVGAGGK